ncbi:MAG: alpha/beta hydrolase [Nitrosomonadales bacterium]|nr:alpha/beta hydrolase [Nitrosomonadales bacterium]
MQHLRSISGSAVPPLQARHRPSGLNAGFDDIAPTFADYVAATRDMLTKARAASGAAILDSVVGGNAPFELEPSADFAPGHGKPFRRGVLLTHGLTDSPYSMRHLAAFFRQNGFRVMAILLPGHGTQPGDLLEARRQDWARAVAYGADRLAEEVDEMYLAGLSAGATLSILHSLHDERVRGLLLFSPALRISSRARFANWHKLYSWLIPSAKWLEIRPDLDIYKYESFPKNAAAQMHALIRELDTCLQGRGVDIPVFAAASADDVTVDISATLAFMAHAAHAANKLVLYTTTPGKLPPGIPAARLERVDSVIPAQRIVSSAHTAIVIAPEDNHYGASGEYSNCLHYYPDEMEKYRACREHPGQCQQGEVTEENLAAGMMRRLMYNPHFAALEASMRRFIESLPR